MTFLKCTIRGVKHGDKTCDKTEFETVVATGEVVKAKEDCVSGEGGREWWEGGREW